MPVEAAVKEELPTPASEPALLSTQPWHTKIPIRPTTTTTTQDILNTTSIASIIKILRLIHLMNRVRLRPSQVAAGLPFIKMVLHTRSLRSAKQEPPSASRPSRCYSCADNRLSRISVGILATCASGDMMSIQTCGQRCGSAGST